MLHKGKALGAFWNAVLLGLCLCFPKLLSRTVTMKVCPPSRVMLVAQQVISSPNLPPHLTRDEGKWESKAIPDSVSLLPSQDVTLQPIPQPSSCTAPSVPSVHARSALLQGSCWRSSQTFIAMSGPGPSPGVAVRPS